MNSARESRLHVHVLIDSLNWGGAETLLADFAAGADAAGIRLSVGYLQEVNGSPSAARLRARGVEPQLVGVRRLLDAESVRRVRRHLAAVRPDIVHTHLGAADVHGALAARSLRLPSVSTIHLVEERRPVAIRRDVARQRLMAMTRRHVSRRVIAVSEAARAAYLDCGWDDPGRVVTVHNGIAARGPGTSRAQVRATLGLSPAAPVIAMVSVLRPGKGHAVAIEAMAGVLDAHPDACLLIAGAGPSSEEVAQRAAPLGEAVRLLGHRTDALDLLAASDVVLLPTDMDAFPTTLLEAAMVGRPAVATAVGGIPEIVVDGTTGILVDRPPSPEAVGGALRRLLGDDELRRAMGDAARRRFRDRFTAEHWAERCRAVYDMVLA